MNGVKYRVVHKRAQSALNYYTYKMRRWSQNPLRVFCVGMWCLDVCRGFYEGRTSHVAWTLTRVDEWRVLSLRQAFIAMDTENAAVRRCEGTE